MMAMARVDQIFCFVWQIKDTTIIINPLGHDMLIFLEDKFFVWNNTKVATYHVAPEG